MAAGTSALLMVAGGGAAGVAALTSHRPEPRFVTAVGDSAAAGAAPEPAAPAPPAADAQIGANAARLRTAAEADRTATRNPTSGPVPARAATSLKTAPRAEVSGPAPAPPAPPVITTRTETQIREIPYSRRTVHDLTLPLGTRQVQSPGAAGELTLHYLITLTGGRQTGRRLLDSTVTRPPEQQVIALGEQTDDQQSGDQQSGGGRQSGGWHGRGRGGRRDHCRVTLDFCGPLSRDAACSDGYDQRLEDADTVQAGGEAGVGGTVGVGGEAGVGVSDAGVGVLSGRGC